MDKTLQLRDIHLPDGVSWWPPALGWWLLLLLLVVLLSTIYLVRLWWGRGALLRSVKREFEHVRSHYRDSADHHQAVTETSVLLRRIILAYHPRESSASLTGEAWLGLLNQYLDDEPFNSELGRSLLEAPYQRQSFVDVEGLFDLVKRLIEKLPKKGGVR